MKEETLLKVIEWATGDDTGSSSEALCRFMLGMKPKRFYYDSPSDSDDRGRCIRLLNLIPEWWDRLEEMESLPLHDITFFNGGIKTRQEGWKIQIPLIRQEAASQKQPFPTQK